NHHLPPRFRPHFALVAAVTCAKIDRLHALRRGPGQLTVSHDLPRPSISKTVVVAAGNAILTRSGAQIEREGDRLIGNAQDRCRKRISDERIPYRPPPEIPLIDGEELRATAVRGLSDPAVRFNGGELLQRGSIPSMASYRAKRDSALPAELPLVVCQTAAGGLARPGPGRAEGGEIKLPSLAQRSDENGPARVGRRAFEHARRPVIAQHRPHSPYGCKGAAHRGVCQERRKFRLFGVGADQDRSKRPVAPRHRSRANQRRANARCGDRCNRMAVLASGKNGERIARCSRFVPGGTQEAATAG